MTRNRTRVRYHNILFSKINPSECHCTWIFRIWCSTYRSPIATNSDYSNGVEVNFYSPFNEAMKTSHPLAQNPKFVGNYSNPLFIPQNPTTIQVDYYCSNVLNYIRTCIQGPDIVTYCNTGGLLCEENYEPYLLNDVWVQCNSTSVNLCPERYYCPNANSMIECPKGHFCREGKIWIENYF